MLSRGSMPVNEIAAEFAISRPAVSKHLRVLREAGLVTEHRRGRQRIYELVEGLLRGLGERLAELGSGAGAPGTADGAGVEPAARGREPIVAEERPEPAGEVGRPVEKVAEESVKTAAPPRADPSVDRTTGEEDWRAW